MARPFRWARPRPENFYGLIALALSALFLLFTACRRFIWVSPTARIKRATGIRPYRFFDKAYKTKRLPALYTVYYFLYCSARGQNPKFRSSWSGELLNGKLVSDKDRCQAKTNLGLLRWKAGKLGGKPKF
jgi:hypothetical protein